MKYSIKTYTLRLMTLAIFCLMILLWGCGNVDSHEGHDHSSNSSEEHQEASIEHSDNKQSKQEDHSGHDHAEGEHLEEENEEDHAEDDHEEEVHLEEENEEDHTGHGHLDESDEQTDELVVELSEQAQKLAEIKLEKVALSSIGTSLELPGEIAFNEDNVAHITPRYAGITKEVHAQLGEQVNKGDLLAVIESNESLSSYNIYAPIGGYIIEKNITYGEFLGEEDDIYVIANLETVWVNCDVYPKNGQQIKLGQTIKIKAVGLDLETEGIISYIAPIYNGSNRSAVARAEISSQNLKWKPGMFIFAKFVISSEEKVPVVNKNSVQVLDDKDVIFVPEGQNAFTPLEVTLGKSDDTNIEILDGITTGDLYVSSGAFELKAKIVTGALDAHAGHGH